MKINDILRPSTAVLLALFLFVGMVGAFAQAKRSEIIGAYVLNFAAHTTSDTKEAQAKYKIGLVTEEAALISEFKKLAKEAKVDDKRISLSVFSSDRFNPKGFALILVAKDRLDYYDKIYVSTKGTDALLVSEAYTNKLKTFLNLVRSSNGNFKFEMNKGNIYDRQIRVDDELLLVGGSQLDVVELYQENQRAFNKKLVANKKQLDKLSKRINEAKKSLARQGTHIKDQQEVIEKLEKEKVTLEEQKIALSSTLNKQLATFEKRSKLFKNIYAGLMKAHHRIDDQNDKIEDGDNTLAELNQKLSEMDVELVNRDSTLQLQEDEISDSKQMVIILTAISLVIGALLVRLFISERQKRRQNLALETQRTAIAEHNQILTNRNQELKVQRDLVEEKNRVINDLNQNLELKVETKTVALTDTIGNLNKTVKELDRFMYSTSHELSAPLKSVLGLVQLAKSDKKGDAEEYFDLIEKSVNGLDNVIQSFVSFNRNARLEVHHEVCNLLQIGTEVVNDIRYYDQAALVAIDFDIPPSMEIMADVMRLKIIFTNLIINGIKYHDTEKKEPWIKVSYREEGDRHVLRFSDNGMGVEEQSIDKIFDMFFRASNKSTGTGLGLYIVKEAIDHLKGNIEVSSQPRDGTTFTVSLPKSVG